jgi:hypothetical protein
VGRSVVAAGARSQRGHVEPTTKPGDRRDGDAADELCANLAIRPHLYLG